MSISRRDLLKGGLAAGAAAVGAPSLTTPSLAAQLKARGLPVKIGVTDWNLRQEAKLEALALGSRIGFDGVQVSLTARRGSEPPTVKSLSDAAEHREEARRRGVAITSTCLNILHINYLKNDKLGQKWVAESIPVTKAMATRVILLPFFGNGALKTRDEMSYVADVLKELGPEAQKNNVILGLENTISAEDNLYIIQRAKSPAVKVYYDVGNSTNNGFDIIKEIRMLGRDNICEFHLKDNPNYLGEGKINFPAVVDAIADIVFRDNCVLETDCPSGNVESDMARNLSYIKHLVADRAAVDEKKRKRQPNPFRGEP